MKCTRFALMAALLAMLVPAFAPAQSALAHARVKTSSPLDGDVVTTHITQITITFTEDISVDQSTATLVNSKGANVAGVTAAVDRANRANMVIKTPALPDDAYTVKWHAVTEDDNGITNGTLSFNVISCVTFSETGKSMCGRFRKYWN